MMTTSGCAATPGRSRSMVFVIGLVAACGCGGQTVEPLDPRDATLPRETRQWIADAEDGVIVARARLQLMRERLAAARTAEARMDEVAWSGGGAGQMETVAGQLGEARITLASAGVSNAELAVALAAAKYELANAERAMLHDLSRYELQPLRDAAEAVREQMRVAGEVVQKRQKAADQATTRFWSSYASYVKGGGTTDAYWAADLAASD